MFDKEDKRVVKKEYNKVVIRTIPNGICKSHPKSTFYPITTDLEMSWIFNKGVAFVTTKNSEDIEIVVLQVVLIGDTLIAEIMKKEDYYETVFEHSAD